MRDRDGSELVRDREVERGARAEAEPDRGERGHALRLERADDVARDARDALRVVLPEPGGEVERARVERVLGERVALEEVGEDDLEAVARVVVREEEVVLELDPEDVGEEEDDLVLGVVARGRRDVRLDAADLRELA